jgi:drug/metabolite transporter (DMT)-like permease
LLLVAMIWGSAFLAQRMGIEQVGPFAFNAARFAVGGLTLIPVLGLRRLRSQSRAELRSGLLLGLLLFAAASLQQFGLVWTTAGKAGFITGLYIVIIPLLLALVWREWTIWSSWLGAGLATVGLFLLSVQAGFQLAPGDECVPPVLYAGVLSIGPGYTGQIVAQRYASPTHAAIILSLESVFAALSDWFALGEALSPQQLAGCGLMLAGMLLAQVPGAGSDRG